MKRLQYLFNLDPTPFSILDSCGVLRLSAIPRCPREAQDDNPSVNGCRGTYVTRAKTSGSRISKSATTFGTSCDTNVTITHFLVNTYTSFGTTSNFGTEF